MAKVQCPPMKCDNIKSCRKMMNMKYSFKHLDDKKNVMYFDTVVPTIQRHCKLGYLMSRIDTA